MADEITDQSRRIVVGVDGSPCAKKALTWAMNLAAQTGAVVEAITTWQDPTMYGSGIGYAWMPSEFDGGTVPKAARKVLDDAIAEASEHVDQPVQVVTRLVHGHPAEELVAAAAGAEMLVVGTRGHGRVTGRLLGSVSQHCVHHAPCPVVVVPLKTTPASPPAPGPQD